MRKKKIYIGQVKKCLNYDRYMQDGDESILLADEISSKTMRTFTEFSYPNTMIVNNFALLIKQDDESFIWINNGKRRMIKTNPTEDEQFFVNEDRLYSYYKSESSKGFVSKKKLMLKYMCDPSIPYGINH